MKNLKEDLVYINIKQNLSQKLNYEEVINLIVNAIKKGYEYIEVPEPKILNDTKNKLLNSNIKMELMIYPVPDGICDYYYKISWNKNFKGDVNMKNLKEDLDQITRRGKREPYEKNYEEITKILKSAAKLGLNYALVNESYISDDIVKRLKEDGLEAQPYIYANNDDYWFISWKSKDEPFPSFKKTLINLTLSNPKNEVKSLKEIYSILIKSADNGETEKTFKRSELSDEVLDNLEFEGLNLLDITVDKKDQPKLIQVNWL